MRQDYYRLLDVRRDASAAELKRAYELALSRANREGATRHMVDLVRAYEVLSNPGRRRVYDETGIGVVPERVPNDYGRAVPWRGGTLGLAARRRTTAPGLTIVPAMRKGPSRNLVLALGFLAVIACAIAVIVVAGTR
jgi:curved DNA-binding protein CbpA